MMTAEQLAQFFHESYERLAPQFGYETRKESAKPWADVPEQNRKLMTAVCAEVLSDAAAQLAEKERENERPFCEGCDHGVTDGGLCELCQGMGYKERRNPPHLGKRLQEAQAALGDKRALARQLDVIWNGEDGAAKQASLCDIVSQIEHELPRLRQREAELEQLRAQITGERSTS